MGRVAPARNRPRILAALPDSTCSSLCTLNEANPTLIAYDGSEDATAAVRATAHLLPEATAVVVHIRGESFTAERAGLARAALPDSVIAAAVLNYERAAAGAAQAIAERGATVAREAGLRARPQRSCARP
jgi:hypothetical protein